MVMEVIGVEVFEAGSFTSCHHFVNGVYEHIEVGYFIKSHTEEVGINWSTCSGWLEIKILPDLREL